MEPLIEEATRRDDRGGDTIWSFGGAFVPWAGFRFGGDPTELSGRGGLCLPVGFAVDIACGGRQCLHLQLSPLDLIGFTSFENNTSDLDWRRMFGATLDIGGIVGENTTPISLGARMVGRRRALAPTRAIGSSALARASTYRCCGDALAA